MWLKGTQNGRMAKYGKMTVNQYNFIWAPFTALQTLRQYRAPFTRWSAVRLLLCFSAAHSTCTVSLANSTSAKTGLLWNHEVGVLFLIHRSDKVGSRSTDYIDGRNTGMTSIVLYCFAQKKPDIIFLSVFLSAMFCFVRVSKSFLFLLMNSV